MLAPLPTSRSNRVLRLCALPLRVRVLVLALLGAAALPPAAALASLGSSEPALVAGAHPGAVDLASGVLVVAALFVFERPRSASPFGYARQLRARFLEIQSAFDAQHRRRPREGKESEDELVPSNP